jgi:hypothetical protein
VAVKNGKKGKELAPAEFVGIQEGLPARGDKPAIKDIELYNLTKDIPGHNTGSTVSRETLEKAGFEVPPAPKPAEPIPKPVEASVSPVATETPKVPESAPKAPETPVAPIVAEQPKTLNVPKGPVEPPKPPVSDVSASSEEPNVKVRAPAKRVLESDQVPEEFKKEVRDNPEILYDVETHRQWADQAKATPTDELLGAIEQANRPGQKVILWDEYRNRMIQEKNHAEAARAEVESAKLKTPGAQLLASSRLIKNPYLALAQAEEKLAKSGVTMKEADRQRLVELAAKEIKSKDTLVAAERKARETYSKDDVEAYRAALKSHAEDSFELDEFTHAVAPRNWDDMISNFIRGNLQTLLSPLSGFLGNLTFRPITRASESIASLMDLAISKTSEVISGDANAGRRAIMKSSPFGNAMELKAFANGVRVGAKEILTGPSPDSAIMGEIHRGFRPLRSLIDATTGRNIPLNAKGEESLNQRAKALAEGTLGIAPETLFRIISLSDKPFRSEAYTRELINQAALQKNRLEIAVKNEIKTLGQAGPAAQALKNFNPKRFMEFPSPSAEAAAKAAAGYVTFSSKNPLANVLNKLLGGDFAEHIPILRSTVKVLGAMIVPFRQFPINYALTALNFAAPNFGVAKAAYYIAQSVKESRNLSLTAAEQAARSVYYRRKGLVTLGEAALGMTMYAAADILWEKGLLSENVGKDNSERSRQSEMMGYQKLNVSGLDRYLNGNDPTYKTGDTTVDWSRIGIPAAIFAVHTDQKMQDIRKQNKSGMATKAETDKPETLMDKANKSVSAIPALGSFVFNQSFLSGTQAFLEAMKDADPDSSAWQTATQNLFRAATGIVVPAETEAIARAQMEYIPELRGTSTSETLKNIWDFKVGQLPEKDKDVVYKRDVWGNPVKRTPDGANPLIYNLVDVMKTSAKEFDHTDAELMKLYHETLRPSVYPDPVNRAIVSPEGNGYRLDPADYEKLQELEGKYRREYVEAFVKDKTFYDKFEPNEKVLALEKLYQNADKRGRDEFINSSDIYRRYFAPDSGRKPDSRSTEAIVKDNPEFNQLKGPAR